MYERLFNFQDPTKEVSDEITVEVAADGNLVLHRKMATSIDISTSIGQEVCLKVAAILGDKHPEAAKIIRREVGKSLMKRNDEGRFPWD